MAKINTIFSFQDNVSAGMKKMQNQIASTSKSMSSLASTLLSVNSAIQIFSVVSNQFKKITASVEDCIQAYQYQSEQELKLATIMRQRMNATNDEIQSIKDFASEQQKLGIYGDEIILQGAQELASFTSNTEAIKTLIPAMNNLIAQQYGYSASGREFQSTADMMGKVLSGQTGALSRLGYVFSEEEKAMLEAGDEMQRASVLAKIITDNVGEMNQALRGTDAGRMQDLSNYIGDLKEEIGGTLQPLKSTIQQFKSVMQADFLSSLNNALKKIVPVIQNIIKAFQEIYMKVSPYIQKIGDFIQNVLGKAFNWIVNNINGIINVIIILTSITIAKTVIMAAAWAVVNYQIVLIVGAIILIISTLQHFGVKTQTICKYVGAIFGALYAFFYNNFYAPIYNAFARISEFIFNCFSDPIGAIGRLFVSFIDEFLANAQTLTGFLDKITGKDWTNEIQNARNTLAKWSDAKFGEGEYTVDKKNYIQYADTINKGMDIGAKIGAKIDSGAEILKNALKGGVTKEDITQGIQQGFNFTGGGDLSVSDKNMIDIADDYRDLLSKRAIERFNLQYKSVTPSVNISNMNVSNGVDSDGVINEIAYKLGEMADSSLGVA